MKYLALGLLLLIMANAACTGATDSAEEAKTIANHQANVSTMSAPSSQIPTKAAKASPVSSLTPAPTALPPPSAQIKPTPTLPLWSQLRIAFSNNQKLWLWQNGTAKPLTSLDDCSQVSISADGKMIAFQRDNGLWVINSDGTRERLLVSAGDFKTMATEEAEVALHQFDWIPGASNLLFNTRHLGYGLFYSYDLYIANGETKEWRKLQPPGQGGDFLFSPDGQWVVLATPNKLNLMKTDGSEYQTLLEYLYVLVPSEVEYVVQPLWTADSQALMLTIPSQDTFYMMESTTTIWSLPIDGISPKIISERKVKNNQHLAPHFISPDSTKVASLYFVSQKEPNGPYIYDLHISKIDGTDDTIYQTGPFTFQNWAPDSEHFVLWSEETRRYYLGKIGSPLAPLTEESSMLGYFSWVDFSHFLYLAGQNGPAELKLGAIDQQAVLVVASTYGCLNYDFIK